MRLLKLLPLALLAVTQSARAAGAAPPPVSIEALGEIPFISEPALSPDGRRIAARVNAGGIERLAIYDLTVARDVPPTLVPTTLSTRWFRWAGNDRLLVGYGVTLFIGLLPLPFTRVSRYEISTRSSLDIGNTRGFVGDSVVFVDPEGRYVLLGSQDHASDYPSVDRVDLATGASTPVQKERSGIWSWFADDSGTIRAGVGYDDKGGWTLYRRDPGNGDIRRIAKVEAASGESAVDSVTLLPGSETGVIVTNAPTGRFGVYHFDFATAAVGQAIFEHPEVDVTTAVMSPAGNKVEGVIYEDDRLRSVWFDAELKRIQAQIDRTFRGKVNRILDRSRDGNIVLVWSGAADDPGTYYVFDRKARRMEAFASPHEKLVGQRLSEAKPIRYAARDGLSIPGYLTLPAGRETRNLPLIVMPHGGPFARDSYGFHPWVQLLASRGYAVLQPNFRGSTGYGRAFVERGYGQWGTKMQDDLDDGVAWLAGQGIIDPRRVCLMGASYGGYAALWGAIRNPELYRCAISLAGVTDVRSMLKYDTKFLVASRYSKQWRQRIRGEESRDLAAISPLQQAARLKVPVLVAHGEQDVNVPVEHSRKLIAALSRRGAPVQAAFYPESGHEFGRTEDSLDFMRRVEAFLEVHNPASMERPAGPREPQLVAGGIQAADLVQAGRRKAKANGVELRYRVTPDGRVDSCTVAVSSGADGVDKRACELAQERHQYRPALAADGERREAHVAYKVSWDSKAGADSTPKPR
jgi:TonB family protein